VDIAYDPSLEAVPLVRPSEVHTAAQDGFVSDVNQVVHEGRDVRLKATAVSPYAYVRTVTAGQKRHA
jgi:hypothetical protein